MKTREQFAQELASLKLSHVERAIAFLWYYRQTQQFEERTASELAMDLREEGFPKPNVTELGKSLKKNRCTIRGKRKASFQIDIRHISKLEVRYGRILQPTKVNVQESIIPHNCLSGSRPYLDMLVYQINGSYQYGFFDSCAVLCRRLMESLIIEIYVFSKRHREIQASNRFLPLELLIKHICSDRTVVLGRKSPKIMEELKELGDVAAHDRTYITRQEDIDELKLRYRRLITELANLSGLASAGTP